jgi:hypothetical protein
MIRISRYFQDRNDRIPVNQKVQRSSRDLSIPCSILQFQKLCVVFPWDCFFIEGPGIRD